MPPVTKRKAESDDPNPDGSDYDSDGSDPDFININFDFRSPVEIDFQALKRLFQQLFYTHANKLDLGGLADHVIKLASTDGVGTTIKVEGDEGQDPYAFVSAVNLSQSSNSPVASSLTKYLLELLSRTPSAKSFHELIKSASSSISTAPPVSFVLHERMINMPPQVAPPLYKMLSEELEQARKAKSPVPPEPSHFIFFSRVFSADAFSDDEAMDEDDDDDDEATGLAGARKRRAKLARKEAKKQGAKKNAQKVRAVTQGNSVSATGVSEEELGLFHSEDKAISKFATHTYTFRFPSPVDAADNFETPLFGRIAAIPCNKLAEVLVQVEADLAAPTT